SGQAIPLGAPLQREYKWHEFDFYAQDTWKARSDLSLTFGLHYSLLQPPTEINGTQVGTCVVTGNGCQPYSLSAYYAASAQQGASGGSASNVPEIAFDLSGRSNHRADFWQPDKRDFSPRLAFAWAPHKDEGFGHQFLSA